MVLPGDRHMRATHVEDSSLGDMVLPGDRHMRATHVESSSLGDMVIPGDSLHETDSCWRTYYIL